MEYRMLARTGRLSARFFSALFLAGVLGACSSMVSGLPGVSKASPPDESDAATPAPQAMMITPQLLNKEKADRERSSGDDISKLATPALPYRIDGGDLLGIIVWDHPELAGVGMGPSSGSMGPASVTSNPDARNPTAPAIFTVDQKGNIQFPYVGMLQVAGLTEQEARELLTSRLAYYINRPNVTLNVQSYRSKRIYVDGEVRSPGVQTVNDIPMNLVEAVNRAGGFMPTADQSQITLSRNGTTVRINLPLLVQRGVNPADVMLQNGDVLRVRSREESKIFISGEVVSPRALQMHNGRLSLSEALGESGGIHPLSGDARQIYVVRRTATAQPSVYQLDAHAPGALALAEGFELEPKDVVYVAATPLSNWHRTISQLMPGDVSNTVRAIVPVK